MILFIVNLYNNAAETVPTLEAILSHGHSVLAFIDGPTDDRKILRDAKLSTERLVLVQNPENLGLLGARIEAWSAAKDHFDVSRFAYVTYVDGGDDRVFPDCLTDVEQWTADVVEFNCLFRREDRLKYGAFKRFLAPRLSPALGYLSSAIINNVWNKYTRPAVLDQALSNLSPERLNCGEDLVITGLICAKSRSWAYLDRLVYRYENRDGSMSRPLDQSKLKQNRQELKRAFDLLAPVYPSHRSEVRALLWLKWQRNRTGMRILDDSAKPPRLSGTVLWPLFRSVLKMIYGLAVSLLLVIAMLRGSRF